MIAEDNLSYYLDTKIKKMAEIHHDVLEKFYKPNYTILKKNYKQLKLIYTQW